MRRVLIVGRSGGGKSTLARRLGAATGLPVIHLDRLFWKPGWVVSTTGELQARLDPLLAGEGWITDGNYLGTIGSRLPYADTVVLVRMPLWICLWRIARRTLTQWGRVRPDMGEGCPERFDLEFLRYVWNFDRDRMPGVEAALADFAGELVVLDSPRAMEAWIRSIERGQG